METLFLSLNYNDPVWVAIAFIFGLLARWLGLPALVGFLATGFSLNYFGVESGSFLNEMADIGVTLLLFTIGLKLRVTELLKPEVWGVTFIHTLLISSILTLVLLFFREIQIPLFAELNLMTALLIGFSLSFSSTVFVVKTLEDRGDFLTQYGRLSIGILVVQDIFAVIFLGASMAKIPSAWAALLIVLLIIFRPLLFKLLTKSGHGELQILFGLVLALGGATLFEAVDLKGDLGALVFGALLASHPKSLELSKALFSIKELFLLGFFLSIGMAGLPDANVFLTVAILLIFIIFKTGLFFLLFTRFRVRIASAAVTSIVLGNFSEFGLIVTAVAVSYSWLSQEWLTVVALLVALSFVLSSMANNYADSFFNRFRKQLGKFQHKKRLKGDENIDLSNVHILVCGMGRVGTGAFDHLVHQGEKNVLGLDSDEQIIMRQNKKGRNTGVADVSSLDFWSRVDLDHSPVEWILLCTSNVTANVVTATFARQHGFKGFISATTHYPDEDSTLIQAGVDAVFNIYAEAGVGLAQHSEEIISSNKKTGKRVHISHGTYKPAE